MLPYDTAYYRIQEKVTPYVHNVFTPNDDGKNEFLAIDNLEQFPDNTITVYNRWGSIVFQADAYVSDEENGWNGDDVPDGTYFYGFSYLDQGQGQTEEVIFLKGELLILR